MDPGLRDRQIQLLREVETRVAGGFTTTPEPVATVWAEVRDLRGREFFAAQQVNAEITTKFIINYRSGVDTSWVIRWKGLDYKIYQVIEIGRNEGLEIMAAARTSGQRRTSDG